MTSPAAPRAAEPVEQRVPTPLAVAIIVGAVVLGLVIIGAVVWVSEPRLSTGPAVAPPPRTARVSEVDYVTRTRLARVQEMRVELPGPPYACEGGTNTPPPLFTSIRTCSSVVHQDYNSKGDDWYANFGMAVVSPSMVVPGDLRATGDQVYQATLDLFFPGEKTTIKQRRSDPLDIAPAGKARSISSDVHYSVPGLPSSYDRVLLVVVELADGELAVCYSVRPNDTPQPTMAALNGALNTLLAK